MLVTATNIDIISPCLLIEALSLRTQGNEETYVRIVTLFGSTLLALHRVFTCSMSTFMLRSVGHSYCEIVLGDNFS